MLYVLFFFRSCSHRKACIVFPDDVGSPSGICRWQFVIYNSILSRSDPFIGCHNVRKFLGIELLYDRPLPSFPCKPRLCLAKLQLGQSTEFLLFFLKVFVQPTFLISIHKYLNIRYFLYSSNIQLTQCLFSKTSNIEERVDVTKSEIKKKTLDWIRHPRSSARPSRSALWTRSKWGRLLQSFWEIRWDYSINSVRLSVMYLWLYLFKVIPTFSK